MHALFSSPTYRFAFALFANGLLSLNTQAQTPGTEFPWQELLDRRPEFPEISRSEALDEERDARVKRIAGWEVLRRDWIAELAEELEIPVVRVDPETGDQTILTDFDPSGFPIYQTGDNVEAAVSTNAAAIRDRAPYFVDGQGVTVGVWDGGSIRTTHQEFGGRASSRDGAGESAHATHVAGTIGGVGAQNDSMGMAPAVSLRSWDFNFDLSEMESEGARTSTGAGLHLTNHSYGNKGGWDWNDDSENGDAWHWDAWLPTNRHDMFGRYDFRARWWDEFVYTNRYTLPIVSAGNERSDGPSDGDTFYHRNLFWQWEEATYDSSDHPETDFGRRGGYETMTEHKNAKNHLSVGAMTPAFDPVTGIRDLSLSNVANFSSWGPTDDGRLKPDVVANGVDVLSAGRDSDTHYYTTQGTSMATPNVTGTAALLLDRWQDLYNGRGIRASLMKALLIHTADDVLDPGPDYKSGWGMVNGTSAIHFIEQEKIGSNQFLLVEDHLDRGEEIKRYEFTVSEDEVPCNYKVTLAWTDPPAEGTWDHNNRDSRLINQLDLSVYDSSRKQTFRPFVLNPDRPADVATLGVNNRDNVEQVPLPIVEAGTYFIEVREKINKDYPDQYFSLLASPALSPPDPGVLRIDAQSGGVSQTIPVKASGSWSVRSSASWVSIATQSANSGDGSFDVEVTPNFSVDSRTALLIISADMERGNSFIEVVQEGASPGSLVSLEESLDQPTWVFTQTGKNWIGQTGFSDDGEDAASSPDLLSNESASISTTIEGPGRLNFSYLVDSDVGDYFSFRWQGSIFVLEDGVGNRWRDEDIVLADGPNLVEWRFENDGGGTAGANRAFLDKLSIDTIEFATTSFTLSAKGDQQLVSFTPVGEPGTVQFRNLPVWLSAETLRGNGSFLLNPTMNVTGQTRTSIIEVGSDPIGWTSLQITQPSYTTQQALTEVLEVPESEIQTSGPGEISVVAWPDFHEGNVIAFGAPEYKETLDLTMDFPGPGVLRYTMVTGLNGADYFAAQINGEYQPGPESGLWGLGSERKQTAILGAGDHTVRWLLYKDSLPHPIDAAFLYDVQWYPFLATFSPQALGPEGGPLDLALGHLAEDTEWSFSITDFRGKRLEILSSLSGTGPGSISFQVNPNYFDPVTFGLNYRLNDGDLFSFSQKLEQPGTPEVPLAQALDIEGHAHLGTLVPDGLDSEFAPALRGQSVSTHDGEDAVVFAGTTSQRSLSLTLNHAALVSFSWRTENLDPDRRFLAAIDGVEVGSIDSTVTAFERAAFFVGEGETLTWQLLEGSGSNDYVNNLAFLDSVRIETPIALNNSEVEIPAEGGTVDAGILTSGRWEMDDSAGFASWISFDPAFLFGDQGGFIPMMVQENSSRDPRSATYTFQHPVWPTLTSPVVLTVNQLGYVPFTTLAREITMVDQDSKTLMIGVESNESWAATTEDPWLQLTAVAGQGVGNIEIKTETLPVALNSRIGYVTVNGKEFPIMQVRPERISQGYLEAVGAPDLGSAFEEQIYMPLGDQDGDGQSNALEWVLGSDPKLFNSLPVDVSGKELQLSLRATTWLSLEVSASEDLVSYLRASISRVGDEWVVDGPLGAEGEFQIDEKNPETHWLRIQGRGDSRFYRFGVGGR